MNLLTLMIAAPIGGVQKRRPDVVHAITLEAGLDALLSGHQAVGACGVKNLRYVVRKGDKREQVLLWPIRAKGDLTRCRECWEATGKKRPRRDGKPACEIRSPVSVHGAAGADAHAFWRSNGDRHLTPEELAALPADQLYRLFTEHSLSEVYDYETHVRIGEILDAKGQLPSTFMLLAPGSPHPDVWHDINRMFDLDVVDDREVA